MIKKGLVKAMEKKLGYSQERWEEINQGGNFQNYCMEIAIETGVPFSDVVKTFPKYVKLLTELQRCVVAHYYLMGESKIKIQYEFGKNSVKDVERILERADKNIKGIYSKLN